MNEYIQEKIDLNPEQQKAWRSLERAIKRCKKENIFFYQVLDHFCGLNGNNVSTIHIEGEDMSKESDELNLNYSLDYPSISTTCGFADDNHFVELK